MNKKFVRQDSNRYSKLGKNRKKLQKWRKPKGRDSKMRLKRRSYPSSPTVGHISPRKESGKVRGLVQVLVYNLDDISNVGKGKIAIIGKIGAKNKIEVLKYASEKKINILNVQGGKRE